MLLLKIIMLFSKKVNSGDAEVPASYSARLRIQLQFQHQKKSKHQLTLVALSKT